MRARRRTWELALMGISTVALGVFAERPILIVAGVAVAAWLIGRQATALRTFQTVDDQLTVEALATRSAVSVEEDLRVGVTAHLESPAPAPLEITVELPVGGAGASLTERTIHLDRGEREATTTFTCSFPTAGSVTFPPPTVDIAPVDELFSETINRGTTPSVSVQPRAPDNLHVGQGGQPISLAYGEHPTSRGGGGLAPEELRRYQPGDAADQIDWKATARRQDLYVREFEAESDRRTVLVVDHRGRTAIGPAGATLFAYAREVALGFTDGAEELSDPLGCWTVGDQGITGRFVPTRSTAGYERIRTHLRTLSPTVDESAPERTETAANARARTKTHTQSRPSHTGAELIRPGKAATMDARLEGDDSPFSTRLRPFVSARNSYVERLEGDPLFSTIQRIRADANTATLSVIVTDDHDRGQLRESVKHATRNGSYAFVFIAPRILYEDSTVSELQQGYERYVDFEEFRRSIDGLPRVTAFEVGPGDRLDRLLAARRRQR